MATELTDIQLFDAINKGNDRAFEQVFQQYQQRSRLIAWNLSHRGDWIDDIVNESWCRAFRLRKNYNPDRPFLVWLTGILQNVYREHCRNSPLTLNTTEQEDQTVDAGQQAPETLVAEAELMENLNDCVGRLSPQDQAIVRLRFFDEKTLRIVAKEVTIAESTLRDVRIPTIFKALRSCLAKKGINISEIFPAQNRPEMQ